MAALKATAYPGVALMLVRDDAGLAIYVSPDNAAERLAGHVRKDLGLDRAATLYQGHDRHLAGVLLSWLTRVTGFPAYIGLIHFHVTLERWGRGIGHSEADAVEHEQGGLI